MNNQPEIADVADDNHSESDSDSEFFNWSFFDEEINEEQMGKAGLSSRDFSLLVLDWICAHKETDSSAKHIWKICNLILPQGSNFQTFDQVVL